MRIFAAIDISDDLALEIVELARDLRKLVSGKFTKPENYHITLAFIGEVAHKEIDSAISALKSAAADAGPAVLDPTGLGKFGRTDNATLWLGFAANENLSNLASCLRANLEAAGIPFDAKTFKPHITIARHANLSKIELPALPFPHKSYAESISICKSTLYPDGAIYEALETVHL